MNGGSENENEQNSNFKSDQELYNRAVLYFNAGKYEESLKILKAISDPSIDTKPLIDKINEKLITKNKPKENNINKDISKAEQGKKIEEEKKPKIINTEKIKPEQRISAKTFKRRIYRNRRFKKKILQLIL